jgi:hypothetical protein
MSIMNRQAVLMNRLGAELGFSPAARASLGGAAPAFGDGPGRRIRGRQVVMPSDPAAQPVDLERRRAALHRRSAALRAPTDPAGEPKFLAVFDAIEREAAEVEAALRLAALAMG